MAKMIRKLGANNFASLPLGVDDEFPFGKYRDRRVGSILQEHPEYIRACAEDERFEFDEEVLEELERSE